MIKLKKSGVFFVEDNGNKEKLKKLFKEDFYKKEGRYFIKGSEENYNKLRIYFDSILEKSCYLYPLIKKLKKRKLKTKTKELYIYINRKFLDFINKKPEEVDMEDIKKYINYLKKEGKKSSTINTAINALKFFYEDTLGIHNFKNIYLVNRKNIPKVFSRKEIKRILKSIENQKHKLLIQLAYGCGLKLGELRRIKISDIDLGKKRLSIRDKNYKIIRTVPIPETAVKEIKSYITGYYRDRDGFSDYLFFSESKKNKTGKITERTIEEVFQKAVRKAGLKGHFTFNSLRDSFVVHLLERGFPIEEIMKIVGMKKSQFYNRYSFYIKSIQSNIFPDLLNFQDINIWK